MSNPMYCVFMGSEFMRAFFDNGVAEDYKERLEKQGKSCRIETVQKLPRISRLVESLAPQG